MQEPNSGRSWCKFFHCEDFDLYLVGVQAPLGLDVERVPRQLRPRHLRDHVALL
jgi:hypothetical protein